MKFKEGKRVCSGRNGRRSYPAMTKNSCQPFVFILLMWIPNHVFFCSQQFHESSSTSIPLPEPTQSLSDRVSAWIEHSKHNQSTDVPGQ